VTDRCILTVLLIHCRACDGPKACVQTFISNESRGVYGAATIFTWPSTFLRGGRHQKTENEEHRLNYAYFDFKVQIRVHAKNYFPNFNQAKERKFMIISSICSHFFYFNLTVSKKRRNTGLWKTTRGQVSSGGKCTISRVATSTQTSFHYIRVESLRSV
jgi:hypothetical protein